MLIRSCNTMKSFTYIRLVATSSAMLAHIWHASVHFIVIGKILTIAQFTMSWGRPQMNNSFFFNSLIFLFLFFGYLAIIHFFNACKHAYALAIMLSKCTYNSDLYCSSNFM